MPEKGPRALAASAGSGANPATAIIVATITETSTRNWTRVRYFMQRVCDNSGIIHLGRYQNMTHRPLKVSTLQKRLLLVQDGYHQIRLESEASLTQISTRISGIRIHTPIRVLIGNRDKTDRQRDSRFLAALFPFADPPGAAV